MKEQSVSLTDKAGKNSSSIQDAVLARVDTLQCTPSGTCPAIRGGGQGYRQQVSEAVQAGCPKSPQAFWSKRAEATLSLQVIQVPLIWWHSRHSACRRNKPFTACQVVAHESD